MGVFKREHRTAKGKKKSNYWSYQYKLQGKRFQGRIDESVKLPAGWRADGLTEAQAIQVLDAIKEEHERCIYAQIKDATFDTAAAAFYKDYLVRLEERRARAPHKNIRDYYNSIITRLAETFGGKLIVEIKRKDIADFWMARREEGVSDKTIRNDLNTLSAIFQFAADIDLIEEEDMPKFNTVKRRLKQSKQRTRYLQPKEYDALVASFDAIPDYWRNRIRKYMLIFAVETGLRREELLSLRHKDCFLDQGGIRPVETKSGKDRWVPLSKNARGVLQRVLHEKQANGIASDYVFCKKNGGRFTEFRKGFKADIERAGLVDVIIHDLRRTFGTWNLKGIRTRRKGIKDVSVMLGHADTAITEKAYAFLSGEDIDMGGTTKGTAKPSGIDVIDLDAHRDKKKAVQ